MVIAQALGEYGAAAVLASVVSTTYYSVRALIRSVDQADVLVAAFVLFVLAYFWNRR